MQTTTTPALNELRHEFERRIREARRAKESWTQAGWLPARSMEMLDEQIAALVGLLEHVERTIAPSEREKTVDGGSLERVGRLCARWQADAEAMDDIASEENDEETILALECRERSRTLRDCIKDIKTEWAGTEPTVRISDGANVE